MTSVVIATECYQQKIFLMEINKGNDGYQYNLYATQVFLNKSNHMIGKLNSTEIEDLIKSQMVGRIGCHAEDITYVVPISYTYDNEYIYGHTFEGLKLALMRKNPKVCFQIDKMQNMGNWQSVVAWGVFEELHDKEARRSALQKLTDRVLPIISSETTHLSPHWPFPSKDFENIRGVVFRIRLKEKNGRFEKTVPVSFFAS